LPWLVLSPAPEFSLASEYRTCNLTRGELHNGPSAGDRGDERGGVVEQAHLGRGHRAVGGAPRHGSVEQGERLSAGRPEERGEHPGRRVAVLLAGGHRGLGEDHRGEGDVEAG